MESEKINLEPYEVTEEMLEEMVEQTRRTCQKKVLEYAERLEKPREMSWGRKALDAVYDSFSDHTTYGNAAKAYQEGRERTKKRQQEEDERDEKEALFCLEFLRDTR